MNVRTKATPQSDCPAKEFDHQLKALHQLVGQMLVVLDQAVARLDETATLLDRLVAAGEEWVVPSAPRSWRELDAMVGRR